MVLKIHATKLRVSSLCGEALANDRSRFALRAEKMSEETQLPRKPRPNFRLIPLRFTSQNYNINLNNH